MYTDNSTEVFGVNSSSGCKIYMEKISSGHCTNCFCAHHCNSSKLILLTSGIFSGGPWGRLLSRQCIHCRTATHAGNNWSSPHAQRHQLISSQPKVWHVLLNNRQIWGLISSCCFFRCQRKRLSVCLWSWCKTTDYESSLNPVWLNWDSACTSLSAWSR